MFVQWVVNDSNTFRKHIMPLMSLYPPLTTRVHIQHAFLVRAMQGISISEYLETRSSKYSARLRIIPIFTTVPTYFSSWLAGFIEAKGSFAIRSGTVGFSFSISQMNDIYLLKAIRDFFGQSQLIVQVKKGVEPFYFLVIANIKVINSVVNHCVNFPLLGYKHYQLATVIQKSLAVSHLRHYFFFL